MSFFSTVTEANIYPSFVSIPVGQFMTCVTVSAMDDDIVEFNETTQIFPYLPNPNDAANGSILLTIIDNDGKTVIMTCVQ